MDIEQRAVGPGGHAHSRPGLFGGVPPCSERGGGGGEVEVDSENRGMEESASRDKARWITNMDMVRQRGKEEEWERAR
jgi:hypothetical protein